MALFNARNQDLWYWFYNWRCLIQGSQCYVLCLHSDLNDQILFHSTIDALPGVQEMSKKWDDQTGVHSGELER